MDKVTLKARAKINLTLDVLGKRPDGYHDVCMIMHQIDLWDLVTVENAPVGIELINSVEYLPVDRGNLAYRAAELMKERYGYPGGVKITIEKNIPVAAGLAGGSTDAAAVIKGINELFELNLSLEEMMATGLELGADVPFCIMGGCALAEGIGEKLTPLEPLKNQWLVVSKPSIGVSTKEVYTKLKADELTEHPDTEAMIKALKEGNAHDVYGLLGNVLETVTCELYPVVNEVKRKMDQYGSSGTLMSGSGPTVFGFFKSYDRAKSAQKHMEIRYSQTYLVKTHDGRCNG